MLLLFLTVPVLELYILIQVGSLIGAIPTISLVIFTAVLGAALIRRQGLHTLARVRDKVDRGTLPAQDMLEGLILMLAGLLLLTPGFVTDIMGFLCLIPALRTRLAAILLSRLSARQIHDPGVVIVEGEFWTDPDRLP
jgi:UPF0716 protein FxsA